MLWDPKPAVKSKKKKLLRKRIAQNSFAEKVFRVFLRNKEYKENDKQQKKKKNSVNTKRNQRPSVAEKLH